MVALPFSLVPLTISTSGLSIRGLFLASDFDKEGQISKQASNFDPAAFTRLRFIRQNHALAKKVIREGRVLDPVSRVMDCFQSFFFVSRKGRL